MGTVEWYWWVALAVVVGVIVWLKIKEHLDYQASVHEIDFERMGFKLRLRVSPDGFNGYDVYLFALNDHGKKEKIWHESYLDIYSKFENSDDLVEHCWAEACKRLTAEHAYDEKKVNFWK